MLENVQLCWSRFEHAWHNHHLSHRGRYSIERMQALDDYRYRTSLAHIWVVCILFPIPPLIIMILMECIPLQSPSEGWRANHGFWIRSFLAFSVSGVGFLVQMREMLPELKLTWRQIVLIAIPSSSCTLALHIGLASRWAFPVPFSIVLMSSPFTMILVSLLLITLGKERFETNPDLTRHLKDHINLIGLQATLCIVYPVFGAIYKVLPPGHQSLFTFVFPLTKIVLSNAVAYASRDMVESMPGITLMSVELFNALYVSKCMQNVGSHMTYVAILGVDVFESVMAYRDIRAQTEQLHRRIQVKPNQTLPQRVLELCQEPGVLSSRTSSIRLRSLMKLNGTMQNKIILDELEVLSLASLGPSQPLVPLGRSATSSIKSSAHNLMPQCPQGNAKSNPFWSVRNKVWPRASPTIQSTRAQTQADCRPMSLTLADKQRLVEQALGIFFQCEFHVLTEYVECAIPLMYALYLAIEFHLPGFKYFTDLAGMTPAKLERTVLSILIFAWLELLSFLALHFAIKRKLGFSPACVLGFVLKTQFLEFQARVVVWYLFLLSFTLYHCGTSFVRCIHP